MTVYAYEVTLEVDGLESVVQLDDTYPSINDWKTATHFAMLLARHNHPDAVNIELVSVSEYESEEYEDYDYIFPSPVKLQ
jgi:PHD/YefM family antitoxin component YafN of YafNO toxin-antitoxin module